MHVMSWYSKVFPSVISNQLVRLCITDKIIKKKDVKIIFKELFWKPIYFIPFGFFTGAEKRQQIL